MHNQAAFYFKGPATSPTNNNYSDSPHYVVPFSPSEALAYAYPEDAAHAQGERDFRSYSDDSLQDILSTREVLFREE